MEDAIEETRRGDYAVSIVYDDAVREDSPRDWSNVGVMACKHSRYELGDDSASDVLREYETYREEWDPEDIDTEDFAADSVFEPLSITEWLIKYRGASVVLPLYLYDHSGLSMSTGTFAEDSQGWDTSLVGVIFDTEETRKDTGVSLEHVEEALSQEVETYSQYLRGEVYGYTIERVKTCNMGEEHRETVDSCYGYYSIEDARNDANAWTDLAGVTS